MRYHDFLNSLTEQAAGNVYKKNSVLGKKRNNEGFVSQGDVDPRDIRSGFQPMTNQQFGHGPSEPVAQQPSGHEQQSNDAQQLIYDAHYRLTRIMLVFNVPINEMAQFCKQVERAIAPYARENGGEFSAKAVFPELFERWGEPVLGEDNARSTIPLGRAASPRPGGAVPMS